MKKCEKWKVWPKFTPNFIFIKKILYKVHTFQNQSLFLIKHYTILVLVDLEMHYNNYFTCMCGYMIMNVHIMQGWRRGSKSGEEGSNI